MLVYWMIKYVPPRIEACDGNLDDVLRHLRLMEENPAKPVEMVNIAVDFFRSVGIWGDFYHLKWRIAFSSVSCKEVDFTVQGLLVHSIFQNPSQPQCIRVFPWMISFAKWGSTQKTKKKGGAPCCIPFRSWMGPLAKLSSGSCHNDTFHETTWQARRMGRFLKGYVYLIVLKLIRKQAFIRQSWNQQKKIITPKKRSLLLMYQQIMCCQVSQKQSWQRSRQGFQNCPVVMGVGRHKVSRKSWKHDEIIDVRTKSCIKSSKITLHISICPSWTKNKITSPRT